VVRPVRSGALCAHISGPGCLLRGPGRSALCLVPWATSPSRLAAMLPDVMAAALATDPPLRAVLVSGNEPVFVVPVPPYPLGCPSAQGRLFGAADLCRRCGQRSPECELIVSPALRRRRRVADQTRAQPQTTSRRP
jgi:hypothetical protein